MSISSAVSVCLWYDGNAEEAARLYTSLIPNSEVTSISPAMVTFKLDGVPFQALNGGPQFKPTEAASIVVSTMNQEDPVMATQGILSDPAVMMGKPVVEGTRMERCGSEPKVVTDSRNKRIEQTNQGPMDVVGLDRLSASVCSSSATRAGSELATR